MFMETQAQGQLDSVVRLSHQIDPHLEMQMRVLRADEENQMLKTTVECYKNKLLTVEEIMLFLTTCTNTK